MHAWHNRRRPRWSRNPLVIAGTAIVLATTSLALFSGTTAASSPKSLTKSLGAVETAPGLPSGFSKTFKSKFVRANGIRQHAVVGGDGPPLLLVHGWPESWYAWRFVMPALAEDYTVVAVDQRGIGLTEKAASGYDSATLADDLAALMTKLGHERFAVVGHDTGYVISYALAADHRDRVARLVVAEIPGPPGTGDADHQPPLFLPEHLNNKLWHIPFNRVDDELIVDMVASNADAYYAYEFDIQGGGWEFPAEAADYYVDLYTRDKDVLRASFGLYRDWDAHLAQNVARQGNKLTIPVLGIGGENSWGPAPAEGMKAVAQNVQTAVIPSTGHWVAEQSPDAMLGALRPFLEPYRASAG